VGRTASISRDDLLDAAAAVVEERGAGGLTLDAVAKKAGVSKGGLLHSYGSKNALISAMLARLLERTEAAIRAGEKELGDRPGVALSSYLFGAFATADVEPAAIMSRLAAVPEHPRLLDPLRDFYRKYAGRIADEADDEAAALTVWLAAEGLLLLELLDVSPLSERQREAVALHLLKQAGSRR